MSLKIILLFSLLSAGLCAEPFREPASGLTFPDALGIWTRVSTHHYPKKEQGTSISYNTADGGAVTIYFYDNTNPVIPDGGAGELFTRELQGVANGIESAWRDKGAKVEKTLPATLISSPEGAPLIWIMGHSFYLDGSAISSLSALTGYRNHFLKVRYTYPGADLQAGRDALKKLLQQLAGINQGNLDPYFEDKVSPELLGK